MLKKYYVADVIDNKGTVVSNAYGFRWFWESPVSVMKDLNRIAKKENLTVCQVRRLK